MNKSNHSCFEQFAPIAAIATHERSARVMAPLVRDSSFQLWLPVGVESQNDAFYYQGSLKEHLATIWKQQGALVFCLAAGAVVRLIAPLLQNKARDPAVVVVDARGEYVISLCSGHQGKADLLARSLASQIGAKAIVG